MPFEVGRRFKAWRAGAALCPVPLYALRTFAHLVVSHRDHYVRRAALVAWRCPQSPGQQLAYLAGNAYVMMARLASRADGRLFLPSACSGSAAQRLRCNASRPRDEIPPVRSAHASSPLRSKPRLPAFGGGSPPTPTERWRFSPSRSCLYRMPASSGVSPGAVVGHSIAERGGGLCAP